MVHLASRWLGLCILGSIFSVSLADFGGLSRGVSAVGGCKNTGGGRYFMTDDQGRVCQRDEFDYTTGCCAHGSKQYQCDSCDSSDSCCSSYEHCVSCCMSPSQQPELHMIETPRGFGKEETGYWKTVFDYCQAVCRTTSRSTQHENAFISDRRFCFAGNGRPRTPAPRVPPLPKGVTVVVGAAGASCETACEEENLECNVDHFAAINDCNTLRTLFMCEAGCGPSESNRREFPGYVLEGAGKGEWPAFCFSYFDSKKAAAGLIQQYNCSALKENVHRVCPCQSAPGLGSQAGQVDALKEKATEKKSGNARSGGDDDASDTSNGNVDNGNGDLNAANEVENDYDARKEQKFGLNSGETDGEDQKRRRRQQRRL